MAGEANTDALCTHSNISTSTNLQGFKIAVDTFCQQMPKIELHAHLSGSVPDTVVQQLLQASLAIGNTEETTERVLQQSNLDQLASSSHSVKCASGDCSALLESTKIGNDDAQETVAGSSGKSEDNEWQFTIEKKGERRTMEECFAVFRALHRAINSLPALTTATRAVLDAFHADNVLYLELRSTPRAFTGASKRDYMDTLVHTVKAWQQERPNPMTVRLVVSLDRGRPLTDAEENLQVALQMVEEQEASGGDRLLVGVDVSGDPTKGDLRDLLPLMLRAKEAGLGLLLHACEVLGDDCHAETLAVLQQVSVDRLGHATYVHCDSMDQYSSSSSSSPLNTDGGSDGTATGGCDARGRSELSLALEQLVRQKKIPIEMCLSSNLCSGTCPAASLHHFRRWFLEQGHPVSVCTDDCGVFQTTLSEEFSALTKAFSLKPLQLQNLVENAAQASLLPEQEKQRILERVRANFADLIRQ